MNTSELDEDAIMAIGTIATLAAGGAVSAAAVKAWRTIRRFLELDKPTAAERVYSALSKRDQLVLRGIARKSGAKNEAVQLPRELQGLTLSPDIETVIEWPNSTQAVPVGGAPAKPTVRRDADWMLRHCRDIHHFAVDTARTIDAGVDCVVMAHTYASDSSVQVAKAFTSKALARAFLSRPCFAGATVSWFNTAFETLGEGMFDGGVLLARVDESDETYAQRAARFITPGDQFSEVYGVGTGGHGAGRKSKTVAALTEKMLQYVRSGRAGTPPSKPAQLSTWAARAAKLTAERFGGGAQALEAAQKLTTSIEMFFRGTTDESLDEASEVAAEILRQLGGGRFVAMTGAKNFIGDAKSLSFKLGRNGSGITHVRITLDPSDTYTVTFLRVRGTKVTTVKEVDDVYADALTTVFTAATGLATRLGGSMMLGSSSPDVDEADRKVQVVAGSEAAHAAWQKLAKLKAEQKKLLAQRKRLAAKRTPKREDVEAIDEVKSDIQLNVLWAKNGGATLVMEISGRVGQIEIQGELRQMSLGIDRVDPQTVDRLVTVNRADGSGKSVSYVVKKAVNDAVLAKLEEIKTERGIRESLDESQGIAVSRQQYDATVPWDAETTARMKRIPKKDSIEGRTYYPKSDSDATFVRELFGLDESLDEAHEKKISTKDPATMTGAQINKELDALDDESSKFAPFFIEAGLGHVRYSDMPNAAIAKGGEVWTTWLRNKAVMDRQSALRIEIELRYGPGAPHRFPSNKRWGPRKKADESLDEAQRVNIAGAEFELVRKNGDGTITVRNAEGAEFDTAPNEPYTLVQTPTASNQRSPVTSMTREQFIRSEVDELVARRRAALRAVEARIEREYRPAKAIPTGAGKVQALLVAKRLSPADRQLRTEYRVALSNTEVNTRTDANNAGRVWDRLNGKSESIDEGAGERVWPETLADVQRAQDAYSKAMHERQKAVRDNASRRMKRQTSEKLPDAPSKPLFPYAFAADGDYIGLVLGGERAVPEGATVKWKTHANESLDEAALRLWGYNRVTGLWDVARTVTPETSGEWLAQWNKRPDAKHSAYRVSSRTPKGRPKPEEEEAVSTTQESLDEADTNIGRTWQSKSGTHTVTREFEQNGVAFIAYTTNDTKLPFVMPAADLERQIQIDAANLASQARNRAQDAERAAKEAAKEAKALEVYRGFLDTLKPMTAAKTRAALDRQRSIGGEFTSVADAVAKRVEKGWRVTQHTSGEDRFTGPDGAFFLAKDITKSAFDFARYLASKNESLDEAKTIVVIDDDSGEETWRGSVEEFTRDNADTPGVLKTMRRLVRQHRDEPVEAQFGGGAGVAYTLRVESLDAAVTKKITAARVKKSGGWKAVLAFRDGSGKSIEDPERLLTWAVKMANDAARELSLTDAHLAQPSGWPVKGGTVFDTLVYYAAFQPLSFVIEQFQRMNVTDGYVARPEKAESVDEGQGSRRDVTVGDVVWSIQQSSRGHAKATPAATIHPKRDVQNNWRAEWVKGRVTYAPVTPAAKKFKSGVPADVKKAVESMLSAEARDTGMDRDTVSESLDTVERVRTLLTSNPGLSYTADEIAAHLDLDKSDAMRAASRLVNQDIATFTRGEGYRSAERAATGSIALPSQTGRRGGISNRVTIDYTAANAQRDKKRRERLGLGEAEGYAVVRGEDDDLEYWTGDEWTGDKAEARFFDTEEESDEVAQELATADETTLSGAVGGFRSAFLGPKPRTPINVGSIPDDEADVDDEEDESFDEADSDLEAHQRKVIDARMKESRLKGLRTAIDKGDTKRVQQYLTLADREGYGDEARAIAKKSDESMGVGDSTIEVVKRDGKWRVVHPDGRQEGAADDKESAIAIATSLARREHYTIVVYADAKRVDETESRATIEIDVEWDGNRGQYVVTMPQNLTAPGQPHYQDETLFDTFDEAYAFAMSEARRQNFYVVVWNVKPGDRPPADTTNHPLESLTIDESQLSAFTLAAQALDVPLDTPVVKNDGRYTVQLPHAQVARLGELLAVS